MFAAAGGLFVDNRPIGVFDSGLGGLVVTRAFISAMPEYDYIYYGDTANLPYGEKTPEQILSYTLEALKYLISRKCGLIIIACNTATSIALRYIQQKFIPSYAPDVKVLGVVIPTVEEALLDNAAKVGVVATSATINSKIYAAELHKIKPELEVLEVAAPELVPAIEQDDFILAQKIVNNYAPQFSKMDSLILGCTHYPLLIEKIRRYVPTGVTLLPQGEYVASSLEDYLHRHPEMDCKLTKGSTCRFLTTESAEKFSEAASVFLSRPIRVEQVVID